MINLMPDENFFLSGIAKYIKWNYQKFPHMVIFGSTGSGKTYLLKILLGRIGLHIPNAELIICDYKSDEDFSFLDNSENSD
jgi:chromosomal replication initiation ATPase DnaA